MEEYTPEQQPQQSNSEEVKRWFQDNLRIIISVVIVVLIAGGIYSYSKRGESPIVSNSSTENVAGSENAATTPETASTSDQKTTTDTTKKVSTTVTPAATSSETGTSFVETAGKGDGSTVLARRALANYLEKNPDSALTKEHKIYIEDYLRKNVGQKGAVHIGSSIEFSKDLIQKAIEQSKTLNDKQLKNLQKYSARVTSLS